MNNASVMMLPEKRTVDGFETQFATNVLGNPLGVHASTVCGNPQAAVLCTEEIANISVYSYIYVKVQYVPRDVTKTTHKQGHNAGKPPKKSLVL